MFVPGTFLRIAQESTRSHQVYQLGVEQPKEGEHRKRVAASLKGLPQPPEHTMISL